MLRGLAGDNETLPAPRPGAAGRAHARLRQYELIREIGRGGMGTVYLARDTRLGRRVAIKFLGDASPAFAQRFLVEARATAQCSHENIVVIHEVDEADGQPYMVLEYLDGRPLRQLLDGTPMSPSRAVELIVPVVRALVHAHASGIVHRDLKPENVFVTDAGQVKVLDFGIAKLYGEADAPGGPARSDPMLTGASALVGTLPYMAPEQWGADEVDHRTDLWAVGVVLFEMLAGRHPLGAVTRERLLEAAHRLDEPMPALAAAAPQVPAELERLVDRCLRKRKADRFAGAAELLAALEPQLPRRRSGAAEDNPYPGLTSFREEHADLFHGRGVEVARLAARIADRALVGVVGPSGAGKSSLVRAGLYPELGRRERWDLAVTRPGKQPLDALAAAALALTSTSGGSGSGGDMEAEGELADRLRREPGALGELLRRRARSRGARVLLFVDQFEELYTLGSDAGARRAYLACLQGAADDPLSPVRVAVSLRSDFLDRVAEDAGWMEALTPGLMFLAAPGADDLRAALVEPAHQVGYRFESDAIVDAMVGELAQTMGALPLLQFAAGCLWDERDRGRRLLTEAAHQRMGGVAGALAGHADAVIAGLAPVDQALARRLFQRLVTPERTRDVVDVADLLDLGESTAVRRILDHLVDARLLVVRAGAGPSGVEIVHESLIDRWPTLRHWLDQSQEDAAFLARLQAAARQWDEAGRSGGLLWRGEAVDDARVWRRQYRGELGRREQAYLDAVFHLADRAVRTRRLVVAGTITLLALLVVAGAVALIWIGNAERTARDEAERAGTEAERARQAGAATERANRELLQVNDQLRTEKARQVELLENLRTETAARDAARSEADHASAQVVQSRGQLQETNEQLRAALKRAEAEKENARVEAERARAAQEAADQERLRAEALARKEKERADLLERERGKISTKLP
jgi:serine/threonine protein kinase